MSTSRDKGVDGRNRDYARYDQVDKAQEYRFAERVGAEAFDDEFRIQTIDCSRARGNTADRARFAQELGAALADIGFAILEGHGVPPDVHDAAATEVEHVFADFSLEEKLRYRAQRHGSVNQGYFPREETSDIHPDQVEGWVFCRRAFDLGETPVRLADFWPDPRSERVFRDLYRAQEPLILPVMQALLQFLGADPHAYDTRLRGTNFGLRLNYYPPVDEETARGAGRLLGHEDVDLFTLLPAPTSEGLQVWNRRNNKWIRLSAPPGSIILNVGDYLQRISNDLLPSTTHRVSLPRDRELRRRTRVSFPMNVYLWENEMLEVLPNLPAPKYPPVRAIEFHTKTTAKYYGDDYAVE